MYTYYLSFTHIEREFKRTNYSGVEYLEITDDRHDVMVCEVYESSQNIQSSAFQHNSMSGDHTLY